MACAAGDNRSALSARIEINVSSSVAKHPLRQRLAHHRLPDAIPEMVRPMFQASLFPFIADLPLIVPASIALRLPTETTPRSPRWASIAGYPRHRLLNPATINKRWFK
jgi:hypothetical protein